MKRVSGLLILSAGALALSACQTVVLAPGAEQVKVTNNASDVASCKPVGNVVGTTGQFDWAPELQNQAFGLGGNVVFVTGSPVNSNGGMHREGVAYHCG